MHGLIFVTFENFLRQEFGQGFLTDVRSYAQKLGAPSSLLIHNVYPDDVLFRVVAYVCEKQGIQVDEAMRAYGSYYIVNELTGRQCSYLLQKVDNARDLLLTMSHAHRQMHSASKMVSPPFFRYEFDSVDDALILIYDNQRMLCSLLRGAIEGAAQRYGEGVIINEINCMKRGDLECRLRIKFYRLTRLPSRVSLQQEQLQHFQHTLADLMLAVLPEDMSHGITLYQLPWIMVQRYGPTIEAYMRPTLLYQAMSQLQNAGLVSATPNTTTEARRYWRAPQT
ncbi:MAG: hypothetical protein NVS2B12_10470 [Ktedonobacteraceae bacterium]